MYLFSRQCWAVANFGCVSRVGASRAVVLHQGQLMQIVSILFHLCTCLDWQACALCKVQVTIVLRNTWTPPGSVGPVCTLHLKFVLQNTCWLSLQLARALLVASNRSSYGHHPSPKHHLQTQPDEYVSAAGTINKPHAVQGSRATRCSTTRTQPSASMLPRSLWHRYLPAAPHKLQLSRAWTCGRLVP